MYTPSSKTPLERYDGMARRGDTRIRITTTPPQHGRRPKDKRDDEEIYTASAENKNIRSTYTEKTITDGKNTTGREI